MAVPSLHCCTGFSLVAVLRLLLQWLLLLLCFHSCGSRAPGHEVSSYGSHWDLPGPGINLHILHWWADSLPRSLQGSPLGTILNAIHEGFISFLGCLKLQKCILSVPEGEIQNPDVGRAVLPLKALGRNSPCFLPASLSCW